MENDFGLSAKQAETFDAPAVKEIDVEFFTILSTMDMGPLAAVNDPNLKEALEYFLTLAHDIRMMYIRLRMLADQVSTKPSIGPEAFTPTGG